MLDPDLWPDVCAAMFDYGRGIDADTTQDVSIEAIADRAIQALPNPTLVVGFSIGGYVARSIAYRAPEKVKGLALVASSSNALAPSAIRADISFRRLGHAAISRSLHPDHRTKEMIARVQRMSERLGPDVFRRQSEMARADDTAMLNLIHCPTMVFAAAQDELRSVAESQRLHNGIAGSTIQIVDRSDHLMPPKQPHTLIDGL